MLPLRNSSIMNKQETNEISEKSKEYTMCAKMEDENGEDEKVQNLYNEDSLIKIDNYMNYGEHSTQTYPISRTTTPHQINIGSMESVNVEGSFNHIAKSATLISHDEEELAKHISENENADENENEQESVWRKDRSRNKNKYNNDGEQSEESILKFDSGVVKSGLNEKRQNCCSSEALEAVRSSQNGNEHDNENDMGRNGFFQNCKSEIVEKVESADAVQDDELIKFVECEENEDEEDEQSNDSQVGATQVDFAEMDKQKSHNNDKMSEYNENKSEVCKTNSNTDGRDAHVDDKNMRENEESKETFNGNNDICLYNKKEEMKSENSSFNEFNETENYVDGKLNAKMNISNEECKEKNSEHSKNSLIKDMMTDNGNEIEEASSMNHNKSHVSINILHTIKENNRINNNVGKMYTEDKKNMINNIYAPIANVNSLEVGVDSTPYMGIGAKCEGAVINEPFFHDAHGNDLRNITCVTYMNHQSTSNGCISQNVLNKTINNDESNSCNNKSLGCPNASTPHGGRHSCQSSRSGSSSSTTTTHGNGESNNSVPFDGCEMRNNESFMKNECIRKSKIICLSYLRILKRLTSIWSEQNKSFEYHFVNLLNNVESNNLDLYMCCFSNIKIFASKNIFLDSIIECIDELEIIRKLKSMQSKGEEKKKPNENTSLMSSSTTTYNKNNKNEIVKDIIEEVQGNLSKEIVEEIYDLSLKNPYFSSTYHGNNNANVLSSVVHAGDGEPSVLSLYSCVQYNPMSNGNHHMCNDSNTFMDLKKGKEVQMSNGKNQCPMASNCEGGVDIAGIGLRPGGGENFINHGYSLHGNNHLSCTNVACHSGHMHHNCCIGSGSSSSDRSAICNNKRNHQNNSYNGNVLGLNGNNNNALNYSSNYSGSSNLCKKKCSYSDENILNKLNVSIDYHSYNDYSNNYIQEAEKVVEKYKNLCKLNSKDSENMYTTCHQSSIQDVSSFNTNAYLHFKSFISECANMRKGQGTTGKTKLKDTDFSSSDLCFLRYLYTHLCNTGGHEDEKNYFEGKSNIDLSSNGDMNKLLQEIKLNDEENYDEKDYFVKYDRENNKGVVPNSCDNNNMNYLSSNIQNVMRKRKLRDNTAAYHLNNHHHSVKGSVVGGSSNLNGISVNNTSAGLGNSVSAIVNIANIGNSVNGNNADTNVKNHVLMNSNGGSGVIMEGNDINYLLCNTNILKKLKYNLLENKKTGSTCSSSSGTGANNNGTNNIINSNNNNHISGNGTEYNNNIIGMLDFMKKDSNDYSLDDNNNSYMNTRKGVSNKNNLMNNIKNYKDILNLSQENFNKKTAGVVGTSSGTITGASASSNRISNDRERDVHHHQHRHFPFHQPSHVYHHIDPSTLYDFIMNTNNKSNAFLDNSSQHSNSLLMNSMCRNNRNDNKNQHGNHGGNSNEGKNNNTGSMNMKVGYNIRSTAGSSSIISHGVQKKNSYDFSVDYNSKMHANESDLSLSNHDNSNELVLNNGKMENSIGGGNSAIGTIGAIGSGTAGSGTSSDVSATSSGGGAGMGMYNKHNKNDNGKGSEINNTNNSNNKNIKNLKNSSTIATSVSSSNYGIGKLKYEMPVGVNPNDDKVKGVYFSKSPRGVGKWNAYFQIANNKRLFTSFSVSKYGYNEARKLSILKRTEWEKEYKHHTDLKYSDVKKGKKKTSHHIVGSSSLVKNGVKNISKSNNNNMNHCVNSNSDDSLTYGKDNKMKEESSVLYSNDNEDDRLISSKINTADISSDLNDINELNDSHIFTGTTSSTKKMNKMNMHNVNNNSTINNSASNNNANNISANNNNDNNNNMSVSGDEDIDVEDNLNFFIECSKNDNDDFNSMDLLRSSLNVGEDEGDNTSNNVSDGNNVSAGSNSNRKHTNNNNSSSSNSFLNSYGNTMDNKQPLNSSKILSNSIGISNKYIRNLRFPTIDSHTVSNFLEAVTDDQKISS
ncbi:transcription factor with AP2 domain(s) [Plasmodium gonderi]|uniref:Transcription factor with AP2 domain(S) n=1 Tax=Plasmodium gonderi TaxID=77519 RepID=A0A1Y1JED5_PLAGO|nr:transcription factor with AP2 domain(s) [Plasmodium gonderi]GAW80856.1 transcription factor with AP2 domain(s) [Plasmodium gonderi]